MITLAYTLNLIIFLRVLAVSDRDCIYIHLYFTTTGSSKSIYKKRRI